MDEEANTDAAAAPPSNVVDFSTFMARRDAKRAAAAGAGVDAADADRQDADDDDAPPAA